MVTQERKLVSIVEAERIYKESKSPEEAIKKLRSLPKRKPAPSPPIGGIGIRAASRKYGIPNRTISRWVQQGFIPILLETRNNKYINEQITTEIIAIYKSIKGRRTIRKAIALTTNLHHSN